MKKSTWTDYFAYLDEFHGDGNIHMFAAPGLLISRFGITPVEAMEVCSAWMKTFDETTLYEPKPLFERVAIAAAAQAKVNKSTWTDYFAYWTHSMRSICSPHQAA